MNRKQLSDTLELLKPALATTPMVRVFECFVFTRDKIYASNDELAITAPFRSDHSFAVNGRILLGLLHNSSSDDVTIVLLSAAKNMKSSLRLGAVPLSFPILGR